MEEGSHYLQSKTRSASKLGIPESSINQISFPRGIMTSEKELKIEEEQIDRSVDAGGWAALLQSLPVVKCSAR